MGTKDEITTEAEVPTKENLISSYYALIDAGTSEVRELTSWVHEQVFNPPKEK